MKKLMLGCGCLTLLLFCLVVGGGFYAYSKFAKYAKEMEAFQTKYKATNAAHPFTPPEPPILDSEGFQRYLAVRASLGKALEGEKGLFQKLQKAEKGQSSDFSFGDFSEMMGIPKRIASAHLQSLESQKMSVDEYLWHGRVVLGTVTRAAREGKELSETLANAYGDPDAKVDITPLPNSEQIDFAALEQSLGSANIPLLPENLRLINEHQEALAQYPFLFTIDAFLVGLNIGRPGQTAPASVPLGEEPSAHEALQQTD